MEEMLENKLKSIILEVSSEMDEFAKHANPISRPLKDDTGNLIGHDMRINPTDENSPRVNVIFTCDIEGFIAQHTDLVKQLKEQYGNIKWSEDVCPKYRPHQKEREYNPLPGEEGDSDVKRRQYTPSGEKYTEQEAIKRKFDPIILDEFSEKTEKGSEFAKVLNKRSIPGIVFERTHLNRHVDKWTNEKIDFEIHNYNGYDSVQSFFKSVFARIQGKETPEGLNTYHLARQYNKKYTNWEEARKSKATTPDDFEYNDGKTKIYKLDEKGRTLLNMDAAMKMTLQIVGTMMNGNTFSWTINMNNKFGRKRPDEREIKGGLKDILPVLNNLIDGSIVVTKNAHMRNEHFDEKHTVMDNREIREALIDAIHELKEKVESIKPKSTMKLAKIAQSDVVPVAPQVAPAPQEEPNLQEGNLGKIFEIILKENS